MPPADKAKAAGISIIFFLDLGAESAKNQTKYTKTKGAGNSKYVPGEEQRRPDKKHIYPISPYRQLWRRS